MNIVSTWGSGKTILASKMVEISVSMGIPVYSNYDLDFKDCSIIEPHQLFNLGEDYTLENNKRCQVVLDEAYSWIESRNYGSDLNKYTSYILMQSRKRGMEFITTEQLNSSIDIRFQQLAEINVASKMLKDRFRYIYLFDNMKIARKDLFFKDCNKIVPNIWLKPNKQNQKFWDCYRTEEIIKPIRFDELQSKMESLNSSKLNERITLLADVFHKEKGLFTYKITQAVVDDFILKHSVDLKTTPDLAYPLYGRLKSDFDDYANKSIEIKDQNGNSVKVVK